MVPYYLLEVEVFDENINEYSIPLQLGMEGIKDRDPLLKIVKKPQQVLKDFTKYDLTCETLRKQKGRVYGFEEIYNLFVFIEEKTFYFSHNNNIIIVCANNDVFNRFAKEFSPDNRTHPFKLRKIDVDFSYIVDNQYSKGVKGVWFGNYPDININSMCLIGNKIENSSQYQNLLSQGVTIKNITILYEYNNTTEKIMITKDGGIIIFRQIDETDALLLVEDIYNKLFVKT